MQLSVRNDSKARPTTTIYPSNSQTDTTTSLYNALGQVIHSTDRNGTGHQFTYDTLGRVTSDTVATLGTNVDGSVRCIDTAYNSQVIKGDILLFDGVLRRIQIRSATRV